MAHRFSKLDEALERGAFDENPYKDAVEEAARELDALRAEIERLRAATPMPSEGNIICVRIGGYYTVVPLADSTDVALAQIEGPDWQETGIRFSRLQRAANRAEANGA